MTPIVLESCVNILSVSVRTYSESAESDPSLCLLGITPRQWMVRIAQGFIIAYSIVFDAPLLVAQISLYGRHFRLIFFELRPIDYTSRIFLFLWRAKRYAR